MAVASPQRRLEPSASRAQTGRPAQRTATHPRQWQASPRGSLFVLAWVQLRIPVKGRQTLVGTPLIPPFARIGTTFCIHAQLCAHSPHHNNVPIARLGPGHVPTPQSRGHATAAAMSPDSPTESAANQSRTSRGTSLPPQNRRVASTSAVQTARPPSHRCEAAPALPYLHDGREGKAPPLACTGGGVAIGGICVTSSLASRRQRRPRS